LKYFLVLLVLKKRKKKRNRIRGRTERKSGVHKSPMQVRVPMMLERERRILAKLSFMAVTIVSTSFVK
jgi:hypothetical protein